MNPIRCLVTAGPTREHLDPIRFFSNGSSGKMGFAIAAAAAAKGWTVDLVAGPVTFSAPTGVQMHHVVSAQDMYEACAPLFPGCDIFIAVAAVADYRPRERSKTKLKKQAADLTVELEPTIDILKTLAAKKTARQIVVGFAAETHALETYARKKLVEKNLDWIVANDVSQPGVGMNADDNAVTLFSKQGAVHTFGPAPKSMVAEFVLKTVLAP